MQRIRVQMLGDFTLSSEIGTISDTNNRTRKLWNMLAYLIYHSDRQVSRGELIQLLWGGTENTTNPVNALKTTLHRVRSLVEPILKNKDEDLILRDNNGVYLNPYYELEVDTNHFNGLVDRLHASEDPAEKLELYRDIFTCYTGDFLSKMQFEPWISSITAYYHNFLISLFPDAISHLEARGAFRDAIFLCRRAIEIEYYEEPFYLHLMKNLIAVNQLDAAIQVYNDITDIMNHNFGIAPCQDIKDLYRECLNIINSSQVSIDQLHNQLQTDVSSNGAFICDFDFFKEIYKAFSRSLERSGDVIHMALLTITDMNGKSLAKRSQATCMTNLKEMIQESLRGCDIGAQCSPSQIVVMLLYANYENSNMVIQRVLKSFNHKYPHSPAVIHYLIKPIEPVTNFNQQENIE